MNSETCGHERVDYAWSHGNDGRCRDCGAVEQFDGSWQDPVNVLEDLIRLGRAEGAEHMAAYLHLAEKDGIPHRNPRLKAVCDFNA